MQGSGTGFMKRHYRAKKAEHDLKVLGWRVGVVWECALKGPRRLTHDEMTRTIVRWLKSENQSLSLSGST